MTVKAITEDDLFLRRVNFRWPSNIKPDGNVTPNAFKKRKKNGIEEKGLSGNLKRLSTYEESIIDSSLYMLFSLHVQVIRQLNLECILDPLPDNIAHALIIGEITNKKASQLAIKAKRITSF